jgi:protein-tyrosine-phosphatase
VFDISSEARTNPRNTILFVCVENTFRSVLSEALFNSKAPPGWHAESAGVRPAAAVNPDVPRLLEEVGIVLATRSPRVVTPDMVSRASRVVTFGCLDSCPIGAKGGRLGDCRLYRQVIRAAEGNKRRALEAGRRLD